MTLDELKELIRDAKENPLRSLDFVVVSVPAHRVSGKNVYAHLFDSGPVAKVIARHKDRVVVAFHVLDLEAWIQKLEKKNET